MQAKHNVVELDASTRRGGEVQRIFDRVIDDITEGVLRPGEKISEPELARAFGVSRGPLREAIRRLEERQLVRCTPNFGARVVAHTPREVLQAYEIREALEGLAARLAAINMSDAEIVDLREAYSLEVSASRSRGYRVDFHMHIVRGSHNERLVKMLNEDYYRLLKIWRSNFSWLRAGGSDTWSDHKRILEAIEYRDPDTAEMLMRRHVARLRIESSKELARRSIDLDCEA